MMLLLFFAIVLIVILFMLSRPTVIVYEEEPVAWWPWPITSYNWWPYWNDGTNRVSTHSNVSIRHKGPTPHNESRPWGGASRRANASAPSRGGHGGGPGGHGHR
jgi:hypothetical protein